MKLFHKKDSDTLGRFDDSAHGNVEPKIGENGKAGLPMEGAPMTTDEHGKLKPMPSYRTDIGKGSWYWAGYHLSTTIATPAAYAPLPFAFAALTWPGGMIMLIAGIVVTFYCSWLLAGLNEWNGIRYYRYRDLSGSIYGRPGFYATVVMQQIASIGNNISIQIVAGISAKAIAQTYAPGSTKGKTLQEFIIYFGLVQLVLSQLPNLHSLRFVNFIATFCTIGFTLIATALSIHDGRDLNRSTVSYSKAEGTSTFQTFSILAALGTIAFSFGDTILPEIQATCKNPPIKTMRKGIILAYSVIGATYIMLAVAGYWAYGNTVAPFLLVSLTNPSWAITTAYCFAIIQVIGCYQIYCRPTYEPIELRFMKPEQGEYSLHNTVTRLIITTTYVVLVTFICCLIPFFGDKSFPRFSGYPYFKEYFLRVTNLFSQLLYFGKAFLNSLPASCLDFPVPLPDKHPNTLKPVPGFTPIDFILPPLLYNKAKNPALPVKLLHWCIATAYAGVAVLGAVGAIYFIHIHVDTYSVSFQNSINLLRSLQA